MGKLLATLLGFSLISASAGEMKSGEFNDFVGQYRLADGRTMTMKLEGRRKIAEIDGLRRIELLAIGDSGFIASDRSLALAFERWKNGTVTGVVVTWQGTVPVGAAAQPGPGRSPR